VYNKCVILLSKRVTLNAALYILHFWIKAIVIIDRDRLNEKINNFIKENHMNLLNKDPTEIYQKQVYHAIQKCNILIDKQIHKHLLNIKPMAPQLNVYLKAHKDNQSIRPVINNIQAPSYKAAHFMNRKLRDLFNLPCVYNTENSQEIAVELLKLQINENIRLITLDIKDTYVNLLITGIMQTASYWLNKHNNHNKQLNEQVLNIINTIVKQNYFQYESQIFQPEKCIAMGYPISSKIAEIYLQYLENIYIKHWLDSKEILFYKSYVDDILILYDQREIDDQMILQKINGVDKNLQFKRLTDINNTMNYLDILISRDSKGITIRLYRKPTKIGTVIRLTSNHPIEHKISASQHYQLTESSKQKEWKTILTIARNNGYPVSMIHNLKKKQKKKTRRRRRNNDTTK
jgi:hypothetical protein